MVTKLRFSSTVDPLEYTTIMVLYIVILIGIPKLAAELMGGANYSIFSGVAAIATRYATSHSQSMGINSAKTVGSLSKSYGGKTVKGIDGLASNLSEIRNLDNKTMGGFY